ncbi:GNAT family N-acetyltransferase [Brevibacterium marinum]|uniref:GNAT superfamily N-acetyltransferase n=1 Tax=Brevibacterium marinum TaxID=418643 RepID=A0A846SCH1_9MICO|nr:GNAT family N-acetyltransferase [Brevibacterium marinum]NJC58447.1 GNAT superfamily N-acetyltransferase [Brevibacterium marinum]
MVDLQITRIEPDDVEGLTHWHAVMREAYTADRSAAWWQSLESTLTQFAHPRSDKRDIALLARLGEEAVGGAEINLVTDSPADVEVGILQAHRRRRHGAAIAETVEDLVRGQTTIVQTETYCPEGTAFAKSRGLRIGHREDRLLLDLPAHLHADANRYKSPETTTKLTTKPDPHRSITSWIGGCPDDMIEDWAGLRRQMDEDVPVGDLTRTLKYAGADAIRTHEERMADQGRILVSSIAHIDETPVGYTEIMVSSHEPDIVIQEDTLVDRAHRGHGIGRALKVANMRQLHEVPEAASARWVQTFTAADNAPMHALNRDLGFFTADTMTALEGRFDYSVQ